MCGTWQEIPPHHHDWSVSVTVSAMSLSEVNPECSKCLSQPLHVSTCLEPACNSGQQCSHNLVGHNHTHSSLCPSVKKHAKQLLVRTQRCHSHSHISKDSTMTSSVHITLSHTDWFPTQVSLVSASRVTLHSGQAHSHQLSHISPKFTTLQTQAAPMDAEGTELGGWAVDSGLCTQHPFFPLR